MDRLMHDGAWRIDSDEAPDEYGVLVRCGPDEHPYWWLLCPVTATLYLDGNDRVGLECSDASCMWQDVHDNAWIEWKSLTSAQV